MQNAKDVTTIEQAKEFIRNQEQRQLSHINNLPPDLTRYATLPGIENQTGTRTYFLEIGETDTHSMNLTLYWVGERGQAAGQRG